MEVTLPPASNMAPPLQLLALPTEMLLQTIDQISPDDIDAFTSTCKRIQTLAAERLARHTKLKREYSSVRLGGNNDHSYGTPLGFLYDVLNDPELAFYPFALTLAEYKPHLSLRYDEYKQVSDAFLKETDGFSLYHQQIRSFLQKR